MMSYMMDYYTSIALIYIAGFLSGFSVAFVYFYFSNKEK
jgi:hypothetical protein